MSIKLLFLLGMIPLLSESSFADCPELFGIKIVAQDGKFLGEIANKFSSDSIFNQYGSHGSEYAQDSIFNKYGTYGSRYSSKSSFNDLATEPPMLISGGKVVGYLTTNDTISGGINPYALIASCN